MFKAKLIKLMGYSFQLLFIQNVGENIAVEVSGIATPSGVMYTRDSRIPRIYGIFVYVLLGPIPESMSNFGDTNSPAARRTSRLALIRYDLPFFQSKVTPVAVSRSKFIFVT